MLAKACAGSAFRSTGHPNVVISSRSELMSRMTVDLGEWVLLLLWESEAVLWRRYLELIFEAEWEGVEGRETSIQLCPTHHFPVHPISNGWKGLTNKQNF